MSNDTRKKQQRAAAMTVAGYDTGRILKELNIRYSTYIRWQDCPNYNRDMDRFQQEMQRKLGLRALRMLDACIEGAHASMHSDDNLNELDPNLIRQTVNIVKAIGIDRIFTGTAPPLAPANTPKRAETGPKTPQTAPESPPNGQ